MAHRIIIYEDNDDMREGLSSLFEGLKDYILAGAFADCRDIHNQVRDLQPDVILMDIEMPEINGIEGINIIRSFNTDIKILVLTVFEDNDNVFNAICAGANGYLLKRSSPAQIIAAIEDILKGEAPMSGIIASKVLQLLSRFKKPVTASNEHGLTDREKQILQSLVEGNSYKMIAAEQNIAMDTVKSHLKKIYQKLQVHSQTEAVAKALKNRIV